MSATVAALLLYPHALAWLGQQTKRAKSLIRRRVDQIGVLIWSARDFVRAKGPGNGR